VRWALQDRLIPSEAIEAVGAMIDAIPNGRAAITDSYIGNIASLLCQYPRQVALGCADPLRGVLTKTRFVPTICDVVEWCDPQREAMQRTVRREDQIAQQFLEREEFAALPPPKQTVEEVRAEMRERGLPMGSATAAHTDTPASAMARFGLSQAEWDAIPNQPNPGHWQRLMDSHRPIQPAAGWGE
jgi:hypothetical protein